MIIIPQSNVDFSDLPKHTLTAIIIVFNLYFACAFWYSFSIYQSENFVGSFWDWSFNQSFAESFRNKSRYDIASFFWIPFILFDGLIFLMLLIAGTASVITKTERYIKLNF